MDVPTAGPSQCVLGVTLPVPEPWAARIRLVRSDAGDPLALAVPPHITLLPPTLIELDALDAAVAHVRAIAERAAPFVVELRGTETFRPVGAARRRRPPGRPGALPLPPPRHPRPRRGGRGPGGRAH